MHDQTTLWDTPAFKFSSQELSIAGTFREWLLRSGSELGQYLAEINYFAEPRPFSRSDVAALEKQIVRASKNRLAALPSLRLLEKIVYRVDRTLQFSIPQPTLALHLTPPTNPFAFGDVSLAHRSVHAWLECEMAWLRELQCSQKRFRNVPFELMLFSSALHSGILDVDLVMALHTAAVTPEKYVRYTHRIYMDLPIAWKGRPDQERRRWYPDEGVACLLARLLPLQPGKSGGGGAYHERKRSLCGHFCANLRANMTRLKVAPDLVPDSLEQLFERIALFLRSEIPSVMVGFATRQLSPRSLLFPSIDTIYGDPAAQPLPAKVSDEKAEAKTQDEEGFGGDTPKGIEASWMDSIRKSFYGNSKAWQANLRQTKIDSPVGQLVARFGQSLFTHGASSGHKLKPKSIKCCVLTAGRRLGPLFEERNPAGLNPEVLEDLYVRAIDNAAKDSDRPDRLQATVAWALREFHCFLVRKRLSKPLGNGDIFQIPRGFPSVDAQMVSVDDVFRALDYLSVARNPKWTEDRRQIAKMHTLLSFFGGLRTMEGLGAHCEHFRDGTTFQFLVIPTEDRDLKTPNALRSIPLQIFMEPFEELVGFARAWARAASNQAGMSPGSPLFSASDDVIIPMINEALRAVTGNEDLRAHNLRHSFAGWTWIRLLLAAELPEIPDDLFPHLPRTTEWVRASKHFRRMLYHDNALVHNDASWALCTLLGHSSPGVGFTSYCHTFDILLPEFLKNSQGLQSRLLNRDRLQLSGIPGLTAGKSRRTSKRKAVAGLSPSRVGPEDRAIALKRIAKRFPLLRATTALCLPNRDQSWLDQTWDLLERRAHTGRDLREIAAYFNLGLELVERLVQRNDALFALFCASGAMRHSGSSAVLVLDGVSTAVPYPTLPHSLALNIAHDFANRFARRKLAPQEIRGLDYWSRNVVPSSGSAVFHAGLGIRRRVRDYCAFLRLLGFQQKDLAFEGVFTGPKKCAPVTWYAQWGLTPRKTCRIRGLRGKKADQVGQGGLAIGPRATGIDRQAGSGLYCAGFRFAMLLASIRFGA